MCCRVRRSVLGRDRSMVRNEYASTVLYEYFCCRIIPLAFGTILLVLALFKGWQNWQDVGAHGIRLIWVLIVDQAIYYVMSVNPQHFPFCNREYESSTDA